MTSRSSAGGGGAGGPGPHSRGVPSASSERVRKHGGGCGGDANPRTDSTVDYRQEGRRHTATDAPTIAEVVTDSRGDVLHKLCNVILLAPHSHTDREQQLKVRGQITGTFWDHKRDIGWPALDHPGEVQVMVTYVDAAERSVPLLFPTQFANTFGETETPEGNLIKWKAALCKVGKKFS